MFSTTATTLSSQNGIKKAALLLGLGLALTGCISPTAGTDGRYTTPIGNAPVINNETPYSSALRCIGSRMAGSAAAPRIAVGNIKDYTGKVELEGGAKLTQGASLMAISGLSKAGVMLVERFDTSVAELELKYANDRLISDTNPDEYRQIHAGSIRGSDYYMVGGITELNFDIRNGGLDSAFSDLDPTGLSATVSGRLFVMNVGLDLRLVDSRSLEVVHVVSYQKQIIGREIVAGVFDFLNGNTFEIGAGERANEPLQLGVRSVIERAILEMIVPLYGANPGNCTNFGSYGDPLGEIHYRAPVQNHHIQSAHVQPGYAQPGYVQPGYAQPGYAQPGYVQPAPQVRYQAPHVRVEPPQVYAPAAPAPQSTPVRPQTAPTRTTAAAPVMNDPYGYYSEPIFSDRLRSARY